VHIVFQVNQHAAIGFRQRNGGGSCIARRVKRQIAIFDDASLGKVKHVPILLSVSFDLISETKI
jgi:hypothetical protein